MKARLPKGYSNGGAGNMQDMIKQAQKMQEDMARVQGELEEKEYSANVGGGAVSVVASGKKELKSIIIKPEVVDPSDVEMLQDLILSAINEVMRNVESDSETELSKITGDVNLPFGL